MPLIKNGRVVEDRFVRILDDAPIPNGVPVIVPAARFLADAEDILRRDAATGIDWPNNRKVAELEPYLDRLAAIVLAFPKFQDGRGYSQARQLRERYRFAGELRAAGQILRDQFLFLIRAGFDALEVKKAADAEVFAATLARYSVFYQPVGDTRVAAPQRRLARFATPVAREMVR
ncbi:MAG: DUF934 domain-containing protein [Xanthobacteraceae bacterium]|nr:DUF934 domain-containing protein [Xanthobacteraceae bacterium]